MSTLLDPKVLMAIKELPLRAKTTVDGFLTGINRSNIKGPGLEFSQYRSYQPGDDLRWLDWKMFARSDRYYIRESEVDTNVSIRLLIDASASMNHEDNGYSKIDFAKWIAASLAYLAHRQGDAVGLHILCNAALYTLPAKQDHQHMSRLYFQLEQLKAAGQFTSPAGYREIFSSSAKRELVIVLTDFYQQEDELIRLLNSLVLMKHEIIVFQLLGRNEMDMNYPGYSAVEDLETGTVIRLDNKADVKQYKQRLQDHLATLRTRLLDMNIYYRLLLMDQPLDQALRDFLNQRNKSRA
jgi:uncharacterized protein (DUF58 family)